MNALQKMEILQEKYDNMTPEDPLPMEEYDGQYEYDDDYIPDERANICGME